MNSDFGINKGEIRERDGFKCLTVNTNKAHYKGHSWKSLGSFGRRKFENLIILSNPRERIKINYV